jgi:cystathionine beta-synthase
MKAIADSVEELIGNTPLLRTHRALNDLPLGYWLKEQGISKAPSQLKSELLVKLEFFNPGGSVKDRIAKHIITQAEKRGEIKKGATIVEATSGNTGAGLALIAALRGYKAILVMPDKMSAEKINALRAFGASVVISPSEVSSEDPNYYCNVAKRLSQEIPNAFLANQYFNPDNPQAHYETTGPEIWNQTEGKLDVFIAGIGTGGTMSGIARYLKEKNPKIKIVGVDPKGSIYTNLFKTGKIFGYERYLVEGIGEDVLPGSMDLKMMDECVTVKDDESFSMTRILAEREAILVGGSCGSAYFGAVQYLQKHEAEGGKPLRALVLLPDSGSRYLSKVFNDGWLNEKKLPTEWGAFKPAGKISYIDGAKKVPGV